MQNDWRVGVAFKLFGTSFGNRLMSFVGVLSIAGLALAVAVLVVVLSVVNGFERELRERVLGVMPHGTLYFRSGADWQSLRDEVLKHANVSGAAPLVEGSGLAMFDGRMQGIQFRGIDGNLERTVSILPDYVTEGSLSDLMENRFSAMIGAELAEALNVDVGDELTLVLPEVNFSLAGPIVTTRQLQVAGLFSVGADLDRHLVLLNLADAMRLKRQSSVDGVVLKLNDLFDAPRVLHEITLTTDHDLLTSSWMRQNGNLYEAIKTQKATMFLLLLILVAVAAFNLVSNLVMTVDDNRSEIAILKTMGATSAEIRAIFVLHGLMVCLTGLAIGLVVGMLLTLSLSGLYTAISEGLGLELMSEYFIRYLPTDIQVWDIGLISIFSLLICFFATIYPSTKAARANPVEVLAGEH